MGFYVRQADREVCRGTVTFSAAQEHKLGITRRPRLPSILFDQARPVSGGFVVEHDICSKRVNVQVPKRPRGQSGLLLRLSHYRRGDPFDCQGVSISCVRITFFAAASAASSW